MEIFLHDGLTAVVVSGVTTQFGQLGWGESATEIMPFANFLLFFAAYLLQIH